MNKAPSLQTHLSLQEVELYIINLDESRTRWIQCFHRLTGLFRPERIHRIPAINGRSFSLRNYPSEWNREKLKTLQREGYLGYNHIPDPIRTAVGLSHQRALLRFLQDLPLKSGTPQWALVLEDDAYPGEALLNFTNPQFQLNIPTDADILFLHDRVLTSAAAPSEDTADDGHTTWRPVIGGIGLEAYLVSPEGARKMLQALRPLHFECDIQLMAMTSTYGNASAQRQIWDTISTAAGRPTSTASPRDLIRCYAPSRPLFQIDETLPSVKLQLLSEEDTSSPIRATATAGIPAHDNLAFRTDLPIAFATCWFNPCHYRSRLDNFLRFQDRMQNVNLVVVELAFGDDAWQLPDAIPNLVRLRSDTLCWQKEALLNHGLSLLERYNFPYLGWLDSDIEFQTPDWQQRTIDVLQRKRLCQVFETVDTIFPDRGPERHTGAVATWSKYGRSPVHCSTTGFGWAMHRDIFHKNRLFDLNFMGGGDYIMWRSAFFDYLETDILFADREHPKDFAMHRNQWAESWSLSIEQQMGFAKGVRIRSLPHGKSLDRRYLSRGKALHQTTFDFSRDLERDAQGLLQWTSSTPAHIIQSARSYFADRKED